jgi:hypothetical protein
MAADQNVERVEAMPALFDHVWSSTMVAVLALSLISPAWGAAEPSLVGNWVGGFERDGSWVYIRIHLKQEKAAVEGTYDIPLEFTNGKPLARISLDSSRGPL